jgi:hypothetical protein
MCASPSEDCAQHGPEQQSLLSQEQDFVFVGRLWVCGGEER